MERLTVVEAAAQSGYSKAYIQRLCRQGRLDAILRAGAYFIDRQSLRDYVERMRALGPSKHNPHKR